MKNLIIKYIGENSTKDGSDIELEEIRDFNDNSWITIINWIDELVDEKLIHKPARGKNGRLKLTNKGWELFNSFARQIVPPPKRRVEPKKEDTPTELNLKRLHIEIEGVAKPVSQWKVGELNRAKSMKLLGDCGMSGPQEKCYGKWSDKIINWEDFPRK